MTEILQGDCRIVLAGMADNSVDSVVTDPPYELGFMGKSWDASGIAYDIDMWRQVLRVLKPGGYLLSFGGTRTYHRMACVIEDAGFEIRDCISWCYGSGFPKSLDISKMMDKMVGVEREVIGKSTHGSGAQPSKLNNHAKGDTGIGYMDGSGKVFNITAPSTPLAKQWQGFGTALKPAHELVCMARKPLSEKTVAANVIRWGTGGINIDGCRVQWDEKSLQNDNKRRQTPRTDITGAQFHASTGGDNAGKYIGDVNSPSGRFPANLIHDGSEEVRAMFPDTQKSKGNYVRKTGDVQFMGMMGDGRINNPDGLNDSGSASRFFQACEFTEEDIPAFVYCAKASRSERDEGLGNLESRELKTHGNVNADLSGKNNNTTGQKPAIVKNFHPTCKPVTLMQYLIRLVTPPGGTVLDPFAGSGTTLVAAVKEGFNTIGVELEADHIPLIQGRVSYAESQIKPAEQKSETKQLDLFT